MGRSVIINTPIMTADQVADELGMSQERRKMIFDLVDRAILKDEERKRKSARGKVRKSASAKQSHSR